MSDERPTHASFFSGVGGLDMGLERAGWRTVSFSEIEPYASAVLAERWPGIPNLGCIKTAAFGRPADPYHPHDPKDYSCIDSALVQSDERASGRAEARPAIGAAADREWHRAGLWTGGFPCQDLSVAGKRRGMGEGTRSGLAYAYLDLVGRHRPRFVLLENVPGLLSSHGGRDMAALLGALVELGYGVGYRMLDARYFGVPQRRRRVFILGDSLGGRAGAERASEVLSVGSVCRRHPPTGRDTGAESPRAVARRAVQAGELVGALDGTFGHHGGALGGDNLRQGHVIATDPPDDARGQAGWRQGSVAVGGHEPDPGHGEWANTVHGSGGPEAHARGNGAPDGLAGRMDDRDRLAATLNSGGNNGGFRTEPGEHLVYVKHSRYGENGDPRRPDGNSGETWGAGELSHSLDAIGHAARTATAVLGAGGTTADDPLLPLGLDSHRYRCCGNGVVADVGEWIGRRLMDAL